MDLHLPDKVENDEMLRALLRRFNIADDVPLDDFDRINALIASSAEFKTGFADFEDQKRKQDARLDEMLPTLKRADSEVWIVSWADASKAAKMAVVNVLDTSTCQLLTSSALEGPPTSKDVVLALKRAMCFPMPGAGDARIPGTIFFAWRLQPVFGEIAAWLDEMRIDRELERREDAVGEEEEAGSDKEPVQDEARARTECADLKAKGNEAFKKKDYIEAIKHYTKALAVLKDLKVFPDQDAVAAEKAVFFSNRSACYVKFPKRLNEALQDADKAVVLNPQWAKGFIRQAFALRALQRESDAVEALVERLAISEEEPLVPDASDLVELLKELAPTPDGSLLARIPERYRSTWAKEGDVTSGGP
ncbi:hypothetical protein DFJ74DRAFT_659160 [Hyaloraphidium curvatum]|nr:hypothetical protein DFJ74DRAFT_659160 [Hyaloraphidium curvatum]